MVHLLKILFSKKYRKDQKLKESNALHLIQCSKDKLLQDVKDEFPRDLHITYCDIVFRVYAYRFTHNSDVKVSLAYNVRGQLEFRIVDVSKLRIMRDSSDNTVELKTREML
jgi:hypothetical protein